MNKITILKTLNGVLVMEGDAEGYAMPSSTANRCYSFNSIDEALKQVKKLIESPTKKKP